MAIKVLPTSVNYADIVRADYVADKIGIEQFKAELELVLKGQRPQRLFGGLPYPEGMETRGELR